MNTFYSNSINFTGKTFDIKKAKNINDLAQREFNYPSVWKKSHIDYFEFLKKNEHFEKYSESTESKKIQKKIDRFNSTLEKLNSKLRTYRQSYTKFFSEPFEYYKQLILSVKRYKTLNCGEFSRLIYLILRLNKIKNSNITVIKPAFFTKNNEFYTVDHCAVKIKTKNGESIIIDGLLNEIGTTDEIKKIYREKYRRCLDLPPNARLIFLKCGSKINPKRNMPRLSDEEANKLKKLFPNLVISI